MWVRYQKTRQLSAKKPRLPIEQRRTFEPAREPEVDRHPDADDGGNGHVGIGQQHRPELVDEQGVADGLADGETADDEKEIGEQEQSSGQFAAAKVEHAFEPPQHRVGRSLPV